MMSTTQKKRLMATRVEIKRKDGIETLSGATIIEFSSSEAIEALYRQLCIEEAVIASGAKLEPFTRELPGTLLSEFPLRIFPLSGGSVRIEKSEE